MGSDWFQCIIFKNYITCLRAGFWYPYLMTKKESMENGEDITAWKVKPFINPRPSNRLPVYTRADSNLFFINVNGGGGVAEYITSSEEILKTVYCFAWNLRLGSAQASVTRPSTGIKLRTKWSDSQILFIVDFIPPPLRPTHWSYILKRN